MKIWIVLALIFIAGFALRADQALSGNQTEKMPDSVAYQKIAENIASRGEFALPNWSQPATNYSPGLPLLLGGVYALADTNSEVLARILLAALGSLAIFVAFFLGRHFAGPGAGLGAAAVVAFYPTLIADSSLILTEGLAGFLLGAALLIGLLAKNRALVWLAAGAVLALAALVRPEFLLLGFVLATVFVARQRSWKPLLMPAALLLLLAPWSAYATNASGKFIPVSSGGGQVLFTGSYLPSGGNPQNVLPHLLQTNPSLSSSPGDPVDLVLRRLALREDPRSDPNATLARLGREQYLLAATRPLHLAGFMAQKFYRTWLRGRSALTSPLPGKILHLLIVGASLAGLIALWRQQNSDRWVLFAVVVVTTLVALLLVASPRRVLAIWPVVSVLAGVGGVWILEYLWQHLPKRFTDVVTARHY